MALLDEGAVPTWSPGAVVRFDETVYRGVATQPTGAFRFRKHLHGADRAPLIDGKPDGEEFRCACALDGLDEVEVWVRNVARHADSFWLPRVNRRFYPDFVAKLKDGRIFVVEYKGDDRVGAPEEREKTTIGKLWARTTGNLFITVQEMKHGLDPAAQMRAEIRVVAATVVA